MPVVKYNFTGILRLQSVIYGDKFTADHVESHQITIGIGLSPYFRILVSLIHALI